MKKIILIVALFLSTSSQTLFAQLPSYVPSNGLVGWWPFNGNANDQSGNNLNGTVTGATLTSDRNGIVNGAYLFNPSVLSNISIQTQSVTDTGLRTKFSLVMWVKSNRVVNFISESSLCPGSVSVPMANSNQNWAFVPGNSGTNLGIGFSIGTNGIMVSEHADNILVSRLSNSSTYSGFVQVAIVYDTNNSYLYVNGTLVRTRSMYCGSNIKMIPSVLSLGSSLYSSNFSGVIDDLGVWNRALTSTEIQQLYTGCTTVAPTGTTTQSFCESATVANLTATGTGIKWYAAATGGTALANTTTLVNGTTYYASQTVNGCESVSRFAVNVNLNISILTATNTTICSGQSTQITANNSLNSSFTWSTGFNETINTVELVGEYSHISRSNIERTFNIAAGNRYRLDISGNVSYGGGAGNQRDVAFYTATGIDGTIEGTPLNPICNSGTYTPGIYTSLFCDTPGLRPTPNVYDPVNHIYKYPFTAQSTILTVGFWDNPLGDNGANTINFKLYRVLNNSSSITVNPTQTTTYWVDVTTNGVTCRKSITITVNNTPTPTGATTQTFCSSSTVANLVATGTAIKWYSAATGGTALASTTALVNGTTYYASQTVNGCESTLRLAVQVNLNNPTLTASATTVCPESTVSLTVNSNMPATSQFSVGDIGPSGGYVFYDQGSVINGWRYLEAYPNDSGSNSGIEGYCNAIPNTSTSIGAGLTNTLNFITSGSIGNWLGTVVAIQLNTSNNWHIPSKDELNLMYTNLKRNNLGNFQDIQYWSSSPASYGSCGVNGGVWVQNFATGSQVSEYRNGYQGAGNLRLIRQFATGTPATTYLWSTGEETNTITPSPTQTTTYWVDVTSNGVTCRRSITITVNTTPAPTGLASQNLCSGGTVANLSATGTNIKWYGTATGGTALASSSPLINGVIYYASQTINGCESKQRLRVVTCPNAFITSWQIDTPNQTITLPVQVGNYTYTVNWGDGTNGTYSSTTPISKTYQQSGSYNVSISGSFNQFKLGGLSINSSLTGVVDWSNREWVSMESMFANCTRFNAIPSTSPNLTKLTDMYGMFSGASLFNQNIGSWNVSNVTRMAYAFHRASSFNQDISSWNVANVTNMDSMFQSASNFNQNINTWNVGKVFDMSFMFFGATRFNQPIGSWNVSNVVSITSMFGGATSFNQSLNNWNVSKITNASNLFNGATSFNQNISNWCTQSNINTTNWNSNCPITPANSPNWGICFSPSGSSTQTVCPGATISNLTATGTAIKWYSTATGGTALRGNIVLTNNTTYYASQTINNVESSTRLAVNVVLNSNIAPNAIVTTIAGSDFARDGIGSQAQFNLPYGTAIDNDGNLYTVDTYNNRVRKITPSGIVTTLAGSGISGFADGVGTAAEFNWPIGITVDVSNNVYVTEIGNNRIRKITPAGVVSTLAGSTRGYEDGSGPNAKFSEPRGITVDIQGTIYVADYGNDKIRKITSTGVVTTLAGSIRGFADGTGTTAQFNFPYGITVDSNGIIYVADMDNDRIRRVTPTGVVTTIAGSSRGYVDGTGINAKFSQPRGITIDSSGNIYISDTTNQRIRKMSPSGTVTTVAGGGGVGFADGIGTSTRFSLPRGLAVDKAGNLYVSDTQNNRIRKITPTGTVTTLAGSNKTAIDGTAENAQFNSPTGIARDTSGNIYVADTFNHRIRKITPNGLVTTLAGSTVGYADGTGNNAQFNIPWGIVVDAIGNVYVADRGNNRIRKITVNGVVTTIAGSIFGFSDGNGTSAQFNGPSDIALDAAGNIYVADTFNHRIRKITPVGEVTTLAGSTRGYVDGIGNAAQFNTPFGIAIDRLGTIYVADTSNNKIRKISSSGVVTTLAGSNFGFLDGNVSVAQFGSPYRLELDETGSIYVSDSNNHRIRKISTSGVVTTIVGTTSGFAEGDASSAKFSLPYGISLDPSGNLYVADYGNSRIRKITISTAPTGTASQTFCSGATVANLIATGSGIKWYSSPTASSSLSTSITLVNNATYYASQTVNGCESVDRLAVKVIVVAPSITTTTSTFCIGSSAKLTASSTSENISGFSGPFIHNGHSYYLSNVASDWNTARLKARELGGYLVSINNEAENNFVFGLLPDWNYWIGLSDEGQEGVWQWDSGEPYIYSNWATNEPNNLGNEDYAIFWGNNQWNDIGGSDNRKYILEIPTTISYLWSTGARTREITVSPTQSTSVWVDATLNGVTCRKSITITVNNTAAPTGTAIQTFCNSATIAGLTAVGTGIKWYATASGGNPLASTTAMVNNTTYYASQTLNGCESISRLAVRAQLSSFPDANLNTSGSTILRMNDFVTISTVSSSTPLTYKWYKDGILLPNSTRSSFKATISGKYNVEITNATGCTSKSIEVPVFVLSQTNYSVSTTEETCLNAKNGKINIKTSLDLPYRASLLLNGAVLQTKAFKGEINFDNLSGGTYSLCITVDQQVNYKECFEIKVNKPQELSVFSSLSNNNIVNISLSGASSYQVNLNGKITITKSNQITLPVQSGINNLSVSTDKNCQGVHSESFVIYDQILAYPNPFTDELSIALSDTILMDSTTKLSIKVFNLNGAIIYQSEVNKSENILRLNLGHLATGVYLLHIDNAIYKIVKK
jgi:surface protein